MFLMLVLYILGRDLCDFFYFIALVGISSGHITIYILFILWLIPFFLYVLPYNSSFI